MKSQYQTERLLIQVVNSSYAEFIFELVNTPDWKKFIGDKGILSVDDAEKYIQKVLADPNMNYWVVSLNNNSIPVGVISFVKRNYLDHHDIGFAFLPDYMKNGYAHEAAETVLQDLLNDPQHQKILAITLMENIRSIRLLQKLGLAFLEKMSVNNEDLLIYSTQMIH